MARRKNSQSRKRSMPRPSKRSRRPRASRKPVKTNKVTSPIVSAFRSVVSILPNAAQKLVSPLADFIFRGFGLSTGMTTGKVQDAVVYMTGLFACLFVKPADLIAYSDRAIRTEAQNITSGAAFATNIAGVKVRSIRVKLVNTARASGKRGNWAAVLIWFAEDKDYDMWRAKAMTFRDVSDIPGAVITSCCSDINLSGVPPRQSFSAISVRPNTHVCAIVVAFECLDRQQYSEFVAEDFGCAASLSGTFQVTEWMPNNLPMKYDYSMDQSLSNSTVIMDDSHARKRFLITLASCAPTADGKGCKITGEANSYAAIQHPFPPPINLENMVIV